MAQCLICWEDITDLHVTTCNHQFCKSCIDQWLQSHDDCPYCRTKLQSNFDKVSRFINNVFPTVPWTVFDNYINLNSLSTYLVTLRLNGQRDWVPQAWVTHYAQTNRMDMVHLLNSGVRGCLFLNGVDPPEVLYICNTCTYVQTRAFSMSHSLH